MNHPEQYIPTAVSATLLFFAMAFSPNMAPANAPPAVIPAGFTALGSRLPRNKGVLKPVYDLIAAKHLKFMQTSSEAWGIAPNRQEKQRGFILFWRNNFTPVYAWSVPEDRVRRISIFSTPGQYEDANIAVYPLRDLTGLSAHVSDLRSATGAIIPRTDIDLRVVAQIPFVKTATQYSLEPNLLVKPAPEQALSKGCPLRYWLTMYCPRGARAGLYRGTFTLRQGDIVAARLAVGLRVLPIHLVPGRRLYGMCFNPTARKDTYPGNLKKYYVDMKSHGMNSQWIWPDAWPTRTHGKITFDFSRFGFCRTQSRYFGASLDAMMKAYRQAGFHRFWMCGSVQPLQGMLGKLGLKPYTRAYDRAFVSYLRQLQHYAKKRGWPRFCIQVSDEPSGGPGLPYAIYYNRLAKEHFPNLPRMEDGGPWHHEDMILSHFINIFAYADNGYPWSTDKTFRWSRAKGLKIWTYNQGGWGRASYPTAQLIDRDRWGWDQDAIHSGGCFQWVYFWWLEPTAPPSSDPSFMYVVPTLDGPLDTISWEAVRAGITDSRYLQTLYDAMAAARKIPAAQSELRRAENLAGSLLAGVRTSWVNRDVYFTRMAAGEYDRARWRIAMEILRLKRAAGQNMDVPIDTFQTFRPPAVDKDVVGLWRMNEGAGGTLADDVGGNIHPACNGTFTPLNSASVPVWTQGLHGSAALQLVPGETAWSINLKTPIDPTHFTVDFWVRVQEVPDVAGYIAQQGNQWLVRLTKDRRIDFVINVGGWKDLIAGFLSFNTWRHVACTYDGHFMRVYIDGELAGFESLKGKIGGEGSHIFLGTNSDGKSQSFLGALTELRLSKVARVFHQPWEKNR